MFLPALEEAYIDLKYNWGGGSFKIGKLPSGSSPCLKLVPKLPSKRIHCPVFINVSLLLKSTAHFNL